MSEEFQDFIPIKSAPEAMIGEKAKREENALRRLSFGVSYLDDVFGGLFPNDVILLGSYTGRGKTELAVHIALFNVLQKKAVYFFALEAEPLEIERRIKYQIIADKFFKHRAEFPKTLHLNFPDWYTCKYGNVLDGLEEQADEEMQNLCSLHTYYRTYGDFRVEDFSRLAMAIQDRADLIILDHVHFLDSDLEENSALKDQVKKIRDDALLLGKPILLLAHLRKPQFKGKALVPDIADFHGSSDLTKIATKVFTIGQGSNIHSESNLDCTFFHASKNRLNGSVNKYVGVMTFDNERRKYQDFYCIAKLDRSHENLEFLSASQKPRWAKSGMDPI
jgi:hypothetical protein